MDALAFHGRAIKILRLLLHRAKSPDHDMFRNELDGYSHGGLPRGHLSS